MPVLTNISTLYRCPPDGRQSDVAPVADAALVWTDSSIQWVGARSELPVEYHDLPVEDAGGGIVIPGLVDCHTHLAFGGWRADEFERRILGVGYLEIAKAGGGIRSTVARTRAASSGDLIARCRRHLAAMASLGVTTVEVKSGYGLDLEHELRLLDVYRMLASTRAQQIVPTLLAAHTTPPEFDGRTSEYVDLIVERIIPEAAARGLARFCDVFVEESAFSVEAGRRVLTAAREHGMGAKLHADQLSNCGGAALAAEVGAVSADHLEHISDGGIAAMRAAGVVAVSLPLASLYLYQRPMPARRLIEAGVPVAVATDFNPGSAPSYHLPLAMMLACTMQRMTPAEVLRGATAIAAKAIGRSDLGSLEPGHRADFAIIDADSVEQWLYHFRANACVRTMAGGQEIWPA